MALNDTVQALTRVPVLAALEADAIRLIAFSAEGRTLDVGDVLFREGDPADGAYMVLDGVLQLTAGGRPGRPLVKRVRAGALIGETALIRSTLRPATAVATERSRLLHLPRSLFHRVLVEHPRSALQLRAFLARRLVLQVGGIASDQDRS